jgi:hypothetical protein
MGMFEELDGEYLQQLRLQHPLMYAADWRDFFDEIEVLGVETVDGRTQYIVKGTVGDDVSCKIHLDAESGHLVKEELTVQTKGAGAIGTTITYGDYKDVGGIQLPMRFSVSNGITGKMVGHVDHVETNIELADNAFILTPKQP